MNSTRTTGSKNSYAEIARQSRIKVLELIYKAQTSHIGSNFSCADILAVLFEKIDLNKDRFVLSAGWKAAMLYYHLWRKGRITEEELNSYCQPGSKFIGLAEPIHPDIPLAGGSMGLGLPGAVGLALAKKLKGEDGKVYVLMSDGELQIGTTWEAMLIAEQHKLDNLKVLIDENGFQAMGKTKDVLGVPRDTFVSWGGAWFYDGHNYSEIERALESTNRFLFFETIKGKGVSFMENENIWHYQHINEETLNKALKELK